MRTAKTLIRLGGCPGWSESLLGAHATLLVLSRGGSYHTEFGNNVLIKSYGQINYPLQCFRSVTSKESPRLEIKHLFRNYDAVDYTANFRYYLDRVKRIWYLSPIRAAKVQVSLRIIQAVSQEEPSDRKPDPWPLWVAGHAQLKFVMTECSKTQIRLTGLI